MKMKQLEINVNKVPYNLINHQNTVRVVCISDTHNRFRELSIPDGDILIHAGDITRRGYLAELKDFNDWLLTLPHKHKVVIAGNHELSFDPISKDTNPKFQPDDPSEKLLSSDVFKKVLTNCHYLEYSSVNMLGLKIYGFPSSLIHLNQKWAFQFVKDATEHKERVEAISDDTDILITHGPPYGVGDTNKDGDNCGDSVLMDEVERRIKPMFHIFGHIHESYGSWTDGVTTFTNASSTSFPRTNLNLNDPIVYDIPLNKHL